MKTTDRARTSANRETPQIPCHECGQPADGHLSLYFSRYPRKGKQHEVRDGNVNVGCPLCLSCLKGAITIRVALPKKNEPQLTGRCGYISDGKWQCDRVANHVEGHAMRVNGQWQELT